jgi:ferric-dicitrate binding protein FerR (iron transport regulator)
MSLERFSAIVDAYGADPARWPARERAAAQAFAANAPQAQALLADAEALDRALGASVAPGPDEAALQRALAGRANPSARRALMANPVYGLLAVALCAVFVGFGAVRVGQAPAAGDDAVIAQMDEAFPSVAYMEDSEG